MVVAGMAAFTSSPHLLSPVGRLMLTARPSCAIMLAAMVAQGQMATARFGLEHKHAKHSHPKP